MARLMIFRKSNWTIKFASFGLFALSLLFFSCKSEVNKNPVAGATEQTSNPVESADNSSAKTAGDKDSAATSQVERVPSIRKKIACGVEINITENGTEAQLLNLLDEASKPANKDNWISLDQLEFKDGASPDMAKSVQQMVNLAAILKCYPKLKLKIGAYSDSAGNAAENTKLALARAEAVKATLIGLGAPPTSLVSEGFDNKTQSAAGTSTKNRVEVQVMAK